MTSKDLTIVSVLHSSKLNGVSMQNYLFNQTMESKDKHCISPTRDNQDVIDSFESIGCNFHIVPEIRQTEFIRSLNPDILLVESLFSVRGLNNVNAPKKLLRVHEEVNLSDSDELWDRDIVDKNKLKDFDDYTWIFPCVETMNYYDEYLNRLDIDASVIPGTTEEEHLPSTSTDRFSVLQIGTLYERKGALKTLEAFKKLVSNGVDGELILVGARRSTKREHKYEKKVKKKVRENELNERVEIHPATQDKMRYFAQADVATLHSKSESFPTVLLEALYAGKPIVASNVGGVQSMITSQEGFLFDYGDVQAQYKALCRIHNNLDTWKQAEEDISQFYQQNYSKQQYRNRFKEVIKANNG